MKKFIIIILFSTQIFAQKKSIVLFYDEINIYTPSIVNKYENIVEIGKNEIFSQSSFVSTTSGEQDEKSIIINDQGDENKTSKIYFDLYNNKLYQNLYERKSLKKYFSINEDIPLMNWTFINEEKTISEYLCKKAITTFRGRTYNVWYTESIPIKYGPWKFSGLPGAMVSIEDSLGVYKWYLKKVVYDVANLKFDVEIKKEIKTYENLSFEKFDFALIESITIDFEARKARSGARTDIGLGFEYSTSLWREPINEYRTKTEYKF